MNRRLHLGAAVLLCAIAAGGIVAVVVADSDYVAINLVYTAVGVLLFAPLAAVGVSTTGSFGWVGWLCAACALAAFGFAMGDTWSQDPLDDGSETLSKLALSFGIFSFALAYAAVVLTGVRNPGDRLVIGLVAFTLVAALAVATSLTVAVVDNTGSETFFRIVAVVALLWALGAALIPIARALRQPA